MWSREISWCVCGNPKAFTHLFILFLLPLHPRIISFPTVYRNRHNHCTFLPSEKRQPPLRLQFCSVTRKQNTCNPPSITCIPLLDASSHRDWNTGIYPKISPISKTNLSWLVLTNSFPSFSFQSHFTSGSLVPICCKWPLYNKAHTTAFAQFAHVWRKLCYSACFHTTSIDSAIWEQNLHHGLQAYLFILTWSQSFKGALSFAVSFI